MGDLRDALAAQKRAKPGPPCSVAVVIDEVEDPDDRRALLEALESPRVTEPEIREALDAVGLTPPPRGQVGHHRRGTCRCADDGREWDGLTGRRDG